jgi:ABC-2 type transport system ATP-binding protein
MNAIELINISKSYRKGLKKTKILDGINLTIKQGEFVVLQGENGAGKTTLLNIILGLQKPDDGTVKLFNYSPQEPESKINVGSMLQKAKAPDSLKVKELINLVRSYYSEPLPTGS